MRSADSPPSASPSPSGERRSEALTVGESDLSLSANAGRRTSRTRVVLPEPLTPVTHTNRPSGISTLRSWRLCRVAWASFRVGQASRLSCSGKGASFRTSGADTEAWCWEGWEGWDACLADTVLDRKSTRLNSSHANISYAVF